MLADEAKLERALLDLLDGRIFGDCFAILDVEVEPAEEFVNWLFEIRGANTGVDLLELPFLILLFALTPEVVAGILAGLTAEACCCCCCTCCAGGDTGLLLLFIFKNISCCCTGDCSILELSSIIGEAELKKEFGIEKSDVGGMIPGFIGSNVLVAGDIKGVNSSVVLEPVVEDLSIGPVKGEQKISLGIIEF